LKAHEFRFFLFVTGVSVLIFIRSSGSGESGQNLGDILRLAGHSDILQKRVGMRVRSKGANFPIPWFCLLCRAMACAAEKPNYGKHLFTTFMRSLR